MMKLAYAAAMAIGLCTFSSAPAVARNYDCSKAGNANKAACKTGATVTTKTTVKTASRAAPAAKPSATKVATTTKTTTARTYDCSKASNANKSACKIAAAPAEGKTKKITTVATYDCTKFYNRLRATCRTQSVSTKTSTSVVAPAPAPMARPTVIQTRMTKSTTRSGNSDAAGASAQCKDGSYSHSKVHSGSCSRHGGVAKWL